MFFTILSTSNCVSLTEESEPPQSCCSISIREDSPTNTSSFHFSVSCAIFLSFSTPPSLPDARHFSFYSTGTITAEREPSKFFGSLFSISVPHRHRFNAILFQNQYPSEIRKYAIITPGFTTEYVNRIFTDIHLKSYSVCVFFLKNKHNQINKPVSRNYSNSLFEFTAQFRFNSTHLKGI